MHLYSYFRSSAAYRVRIALNIKQLPVDVVPIHLVNNGGEQHSISYQEINPQQLVPSLIVGQHVLTQSLAIIEYLDEIHPNPPLLPQNPIEKAKVRAMAQLIACDTHPLNNLRVLQYLQNNLHVSSEEKNAWYKHWIYTNFDALEKTLEQTAGKYCFGDTLTLADCCVIPQVFNAQRFNCDLSRYPTISRVVDYCNSLEAFIKASPEHQPDAT